MKQTRNFYFMGIGGTGMASVAGLMKEAGFAVCGSDSGVYPPMSDVLQEGGIDYKTPYDPQNLAGQSIDEIVVANVLSRGHKELEAGIAANIKLTSFPQLLEDYILPTRSPVVISGTHGKTTTTTLAAHVLQQLGVDPGYIIGGLPKNFKRGYHLGTHRLFLLEGDEYDTAYFDKESKFLHYLPEYLIFNNLEFDHADIFSSLGEIDQAFAKLIKLVENPTKIMANVDDEGVVRVLADLGLTNKVTRVAGFGENAADFSVREYDFDAKKDMWRVNIEAHGERIELETKLSGPHNMCNLCQVVALVYRAAADQVIPAFSVEQLQQAVASFDGVTRRLDKLGEFNGALVYEDFAHHPTSVKLVLESLKKMYPDKKLIAAFEPKNATSRRNIFTDRFADSLSSADEVWIGECPNDQRIDAKQRMNTHELAQKVRTSSQAFATNAELLDHARKNLGANQVMVFMSPGSFSGIQHSLVSR